MALPTIQGEFRIVTEPDVQFTKSGKPVCNLRVVADRRKQDENGEWQTDRECWLNIAAFDKMAENMAESFDKGDLVVLRGQLETRSFQREDGSYGMSAEAVVDWIGHSVKHDVARSQRLDRKQSHQQSQQREPWAEQTAQQEAPPF